MDRGWNRHTVAVPPSPLVVSSPPRCPWAFEGWLGWRSGHSSRQARPSPLKGTRLPRSVRTRLFAADPPPMKWAFGPTQERPCRPRFDPQSQPQCGAPKCMTLAQKRHPHGGRAARVGLARRSMVGLDPPVHVALARHCRGGSLEGRQVRIPA